MMIRLLTTLLFILPLYVSAQGDALTTEERAYLFHIVRKSPILENNIGRYFNYTGPEITFGNNKLNYDSIETHIINNPEFLTIYTSEIQKSPIGLLAEASNKVAIWELIKILLAKRMKDDETFKIYQSRYERFENLLLFHLPAAALKDEDGGRVIHPKTEQLLNPGLHLNDKIKMAESFHFLNDNDQLTTLNAINKSINEYVKQRTQEIFQHLGGRSDQFQNVLVAAGDGSLTAGLLEEREKDENGRWNKGLPKAIGLFPYQLQFIPQKEKDISPIQPRRVAGNDFQTFGNNKITNIHLDIWGYNTDKQTTVVIEKNGRTYHLFGSGETRFLSPDSAFAKGTTYQYIINGLKNQIAVIDEKIHGKKGYDYWIGFYENKKEDLKAQIFNLEHDIANVTSYTIHTKKNSKKAVAGELDKTYYDKKTRKEKQQLYIQKNGELEDTKRKIQALKKEKEAALEKRSILQSKLDHAVDAFGRNWVPFTVNEGLYIYEDSTTFDMTTQEFRFPAKQEAEQFEIRLLAIPNTATTNQADEVMMHINVTSTEPDYNARVRLRFNDVFASNSWKLDRPVLQEEDSMSVRVFLEQLLDKKKEFRLITRGNGIGKWNGFAAVYNASQTELESYPTSKEDSTFKRLRTSEVNIFVDRAIIMEINSFTDPVRSKFEITNQSVADAKNKNNLTYNQILSAYRTASILFRLQEELNVKAGEYFDREKAKIIIDRLNTTFSQAKILVGKVSLKATLLKN